MLICEWSTSLNNQWNSEWIFLVNQSCSPRFCQKSWKRHAITKTQFSKYFYTFCATSVYVSYWALYCFTSQRVHIAFIRTCISSWHHYYCPNDIRTWGLVRRVERLSLIIIWLFYTPPCWIHPLTKHHGSSSLQGKKKGVWVCVCVSVCHW